MSDLYFYTKFELLHPVISANRILSIMRFVEGVQKAALQWGGGKKKMPRGDEDID